MGKNRIIYRHWAGAIALAPEKNGEENQAELITTEVRAVIARLEPNERMVVERHYLQFEELSSIADSLGISPNRVQVIHLRALRKLRKLLAPFVRRQFGVAEDVATRCPICRSPFRAEIDELIRARNPRRPWRVLLEKLRADFGLRLRSHQTVIVHQRYHE